MADGQATKIFLPTESTAMLGALGGIKELFGSVDGDGAADGKSSGGLMRRRQT